MWMVFLILSIAIVILAVLWVAILPVSTTTTTNTPLSGGRVYLNQSQYVGLLGGGGVYNTTLNVNVSNISGYLSIINQNSSVDGWPYNNVTKVWESEYKFNSSNYSSVPKLGFQVVLESPNAKQIYQHLMYRSSVVYTIINATNNGMTYVYGEETNPRFTLSVLVGYKSNYLTLYYGIGGNSTPDAIASVITLNLP